MNNFKLALENVSRCNNKMCFALAKAAGHHHWAKEQLCHCPLVSASPVFHYRRDKNVVPYAFIFFSCSLTLLKEQWTTECSVGGTLPFLSPSPSAPDMYWNQALRTAGELLRIAEPKTHGTAAEGENMMMNTDLSFKTIFSHTFKDKQKLSFLHLY